jgi:hypothetical protein
MKEIDGPRARSGTWCGGDGLWKWENGALPLPNQAFPTTAHDLGMMGWGATNEGCRDERVGLGSGRAEFESSVRQF